jgi:predicted MFS family arabinose efflux permease
MPMNKPDRPSTATLTLLCIWAIFVVHGIDRSVLLVLLEPIRIEFHLSDSEIGLLTGLGYGVPFAVAGIPLGALADRLKRTWFLAALVALWSTLTALGGFAHSFVWLVLARAGVGASESGAPPTMLSLLGDTFDDKSRPAALSVYYTAPFVGLMVGSTAAGLIAQRYGWRAALLGIGLPGLLLAGAALALREPQRSRPQATAPHAAAPVPIPAALAYMMRDRKIRRLIAALVLGGFVTLALANWTPAFLQRVHGLSPRQAGGLTALAIGLTGMLGSLAGGGLAARFGGGNPARLRRLCGGAVLLATPLACAAPLVPSTGLAVLCLGLWAFIGSAYLGPGWGLGLAETPPEMRGTVMAAILVATNLIGAGLGPQSVGLLSDLFAGLGDGAHLQHAMSAVSLMGLLTAWLFAS